MLKSRTLTEKVTLTLATVTADEYGQRSMGEAVPVLTVPAKVTQMSVQKAMLTFQQADIVGLDIEMRRNNVVFNGMEWRGHKLSFLTPDDIDNRSRTIRIKAYYQTDNPECNG